MADGEVIVDVGMNTDEAIKQWSNYTNYIDKSTRSLESSMKASANRILKLNDQLTEVKRSGRQAVKEMLAVQQEITDFKQMRVELDLLGVQVDSLNSKRRSLATIGKNGKSYVPTENLQEYARISDQIETINVRIRELNRLIEAGTPELQKNEQKYIDLKNRVEEYKEKVRSIKGEISSQKNDFLQMQSAYENMKNNQVKSNELTKKIEKNHRNIVTHSKKSGINIAGGLKSLLRMSLALVGIRGLYTGMTTLVNRWLNSEEEVAKQTKADMESIKDSLSQLLAPAIKGVVSLLYEALGVIGAITKAMFNLDIFTKKTAKNTAESSKNAKSMLASFDKIDVLNNDNNETGEPEATDFTPYIKKYETLANEVKEIFSTILDPFKKAWDTKGKDVMQSLETSAKNVNGLFKSIGNSYLNLFENGTIQTQAETMLGILEKILKTIGNIASVWKNAWENDNNGDKIVQNLADGWTTFLEIIGAVIETVENFTKSEAYQRLANSSIKMVETLTRFIKYLLDSIKDWYANGGGEELLSSVLEFFAEFGTFINDTLVALGPALESIIDSIKPAFESLTKILTDSVKILKDIVSLIDAAMTGDWERVKQSASDLWEDFQQLREDELSHTKNLLKVGAIQGKTIKGLKDYLKAQNNIGKNTEKQLRLDESINEIIKNRPSLLSNNEIINSNEELLKNSEELKTNVVEDYQEMSNKTVAEAKFMTLGVVDAFKQLSNNSSNIEKIVVPTLTNPFSKSRELALTTLKNLKTSTNTEMSSLRLDTATQSNIQNQIKSPFATGKDSITTILGTISKSVNSELSKVNVTNDTKNQLVNQVTSPFSTIKDKLKSIFSTIKDTLETSFSGLQNKDLFNNIIGKFESLGNSIKSGFGNAFKGIGDLFSQFNVSSLNNKVRDLLSKVKFPKLARGGIVTQTTPAIIGEAGKEAVIPLENNTEFLDALAERLSGGTGDININFTGSLSQLARVLKPEIDKENRRIGNTVVKGGVY